MKLTDNYIKNLKPTEKKRFIHGDMSNNRHGFAICVYPRSEKFPSGTKSWFFIYKFEGKRCFLRLGKYPTISLAEARIKFDYHWEIYISGKNPGLVEKEDEIERIKAPTVKDLCDEYMEKHAKRFKKSWKEDERILAREVIPALGKRKATDIIKRDILALLESIIERGSPSMANNCFQVIRKMFNFAVERDILQFSPCTGLKLPTQKKSRERVLSEDEIKSFWSNIDACAMSREIQNALKLILVTAQRPGEVIGMHTSEIDGDWWIIPSDRAKNGKAHRVYLTNIAKQIIENAIRHARILQEILPDSSYKGYIFTSPHKNKGTSINRHALSIAVMRNLAFPVLDDNGQNVMDNDGIKQTINNFATKHFTPHDLRRTAATFMAKSGQMNEVIDAVLNHTMQGIIKVYNLYSYEKEKQSALSEWADRLATIISKVEAENVG